MVYCEPDSSSPWNYRAEELDHPFSIVARYYLEAVVLLRAGNNCNETNAFHLEQHRRLFCSTASGKVKNTIRRIACDCRDRSRSNGISGIPRQHARKSRHIPLRSRIVPFHLMADVQESQSDKMAHGDRWSVGAVHRCPLRFAHQGWLRHIQLRLEPVRRPPRILQQWLNLPYGLNRAEVGLVFHQRCAAHHFLRLRCAVAILLVGSFDLAENKRS